MKSIQWAISICRLNFFLTILELWKIQKFHCTQNFKIFFSLIKTDNEFNNSILRGRHKWNYFLFSFLFTLSLIFNHYYSSFVVFSAFLSLQTICKWFKIIIGLVTTCLNQNSWISNKGQTMHFHFLEINTHKLNEII